MAHKNVPERPYFSGEHPIRFAHRGSRELWPENTWHGFDRAVQDLGLRYIETDVRVTVDGVVVIFHDDTLERCTNGVGRINEWRWDDIRHLDAAYNFSPDGEDFPLRAKDVAVPTLEETFDRYPNTFFNIDLKANGTEWAVAEIVRTMGREDSVLVGGFSDRRIARFRRITKGRVATSAGPRDAVAMFIASRAGRGVPSRVDAYQLPYKTSRIVVDKRLIDAVHSSGKQIHTWTVNDQREMVKFLDLGVDGIITDRPDTLNEVMEVPSGKQG